MHPGRKNRSRRSSRAREGGEIGQKPIAVQNRRDPSSDHLERSLLKALRFCVSRLAHQCYFGNAALLVGGARDVSVSCFVFFIVQVIQGFQSRFLS